MLVFIVERFIWKILLSHVSLYTLSVEEEKQEKSERNLFSLLKNVI